MKKGSSIYSPAITSKGRASQGSFKPVKPSAPGASKKSPRRGASSSKLSPKKKQNKNHIVYDDYLTKTLLEGSLGQEARYTLHLPSPSLSSESLSTSL
jgi:hypothetical protein